MHREAWRGLALAAGVCLAAPVASAQAPREMSLDEALAFADGHAPALVVEIERSKRGDAERSAAAAFFPENPSFALSGGARFGGGQDGGDVGAELSQQLEVAGEPGLRRDAAEARARAFDAELARVRFEVHQRVHVSFHAALVAKEAERANEELLTYSEQLLDVAKKQVQAGEVSPLAEKLARAEVSRAKERQLAAQQEHESARIDLGLIVGLPSTEVAPRGVLHSPGETAPLASLLELARERQPELRKRRAEIEAAKAQVALADREAFPKPAVGVSYSAEGVAPGSKATQQIVLGTISVPLPLWRQNDGPRAHARAELAIAETEARTLAATLENRIAKAKARVDSDAKRIALYTSEVLPAVDENVRLMQQAFALGDQDITAVMLARERLITARAEALAAYRDYFTALADLEAEVGAEVEAKHKHDENQADHHDHDEHTGEGEHR